MNIDREGARAAGWTDQQIDAYIMSQSAEPAPAVMAPKIPEEPKITEPLIDRSAERDALLNAGLSSVGIDMAQKAALGAGAGVGAYSTYKLGEKIFGPKTPGPVIPTTATPAPVATAPAAPQIQAPVASGGVPRPMPMSATPPPLPATPPPLPTTAAAPAQTVQQMAMQRLQQLGGMAQRVAPTLASAAPAAAIAAPFMAAGSRVADIQARPNAPEYATNPRAMSERSGGKMTPGQAGELNRRRAAAGFYNR